MEISDESDGEWAQPAKPKVAALLSPHLMLCITERRSEKRMCLEGTRRPQIQEYRVFFAQDTYRHAPLNLPLGSVSTQCGCCMSFTQACHGYRLGQRPKRRRQRPRLRHLRRLSRPCPPRPQLRQSAWRALHTHVATLRIVAGSRWCIECVGHSNYQQAAVLWFAKLQGLLAATVHAGACLVCAHYYMQTSM